MSRNANANCILKLHLLECGPTLAKLIINDKDYRTYAYCNDKDRTMIFETNETLKPDPQMIQFPTRTVKVRFSKMNLEELPNEILTMVIQRLSPPDRFSLRKTSRRLHILVEAESILPMDPQRIFVDFVNQALVVSSGKCERDFESFAVANLSLVERRKQDPCGQPLNRRLDQRFHGCCDVGDDWPIFFAKYVHKLNKLYQQKKITCFLHVELSTLEIPSTLLRLSVNFNKILMQDRSKFYNIPLPKPLEDWIANTKMSTGHLQISFMVSPSQIDRITTPVFGCLLSDECAVHVLNKFSNDALPEVTLWVLEIRYSNPRQFVEALQAQYNLRPQRLQHLQPREFVLRNITVELEVLPSLESRSNSGYFIFLRKLE